ncbi:hypothetical protein Dsin_011122 [Dipteronia sinensis]|uniref:dUTPase-like domain-containing protein n=1 Tax=Dipteronia sinensis TaxID=43782 RepID=A0AAE0AV07_9ROSI|nr:hypothetical protein Dsin_011122 [Dipteronia sinensis]
MEEVILICKKEADNSGSERWRDQQEREELQKNISECDAAATTRKRKLLMEPRLSPPISLDKKKKNEIEYLRKVSRQKYLKKREAKKLEEKRVEIEENNQHYLFEGNQKLRLDKEIYHLIKKRTTKVDDTNYYRLPEAYDPKKVYEQYSQESAVAGEKNQEDWEGHQMWKATLKYGSKNKKQRIAQLILQKIVTPGVLEVEDLDSTARGTGGFWFYWCLCLLFSSFFGVLG